MKPAPRPRRFPYLGLLRLIATLRKCKKGYNTQLKLDAVRRDGQRTGTGKAAIERRAKQEAAVTATAGQPQQCGSRHYGSLCQPRNRDKAAPSRQWTPQLLAPFISSITKLKALSPLGRPELACMFRSCRSLAPLGNQPGPSLRRRARQRTVLPSGRRCHQLVGLCLVDQQGLHQQRRR